MVCGEAEIVIGAGQTLDSAASEQLRAHLATCGACRDLAELYGYEVLVAPRRELPRVSESTYLRHRVLGHGGMGTTYAGWDVRLERPVAIKEPHFKIGNTPEAEVIRRFAREAKLTARLQHPAIVTIYEAGYFGEEPGERPFYTMEPIDGHPLDIEIATRRSLEERLKLLPHLTTIANAVAYAHEHGVIHRDIKPPNILIGRFGEAVLIDWGLAKEIEEADLPLGEDSAGLLTRIGAGTPSYMPPEQAMGLPATPHFDVYALGATLYQLVCGVEPYHDVPQEAVRKQLFGMPPRSCGEIEPRAPRDLVAIVEKAMARDPSKRFDTAAGLARELGRYQAGQLVESYQHSKLELLRRWFWRHRTIVTTTTIATVAIAAIAVASIHRIIAARSAAVIAQKRAEASEHHTLQVLTQTQEQHGRIALASGRSRDFLSGAESFATAEPSDPRTATKISMAESLRMASTAPQTSLVQYGRSLTHLVSVHDDALAMVVAGTDLVVSDLTGQHRHSRTFAGDTLAIAAPPNGAVIAVVTEKGNAFVVPADSLAADMPLERVSGAHFNAVGISPDGSWIAGSDETGRIVMWSMSDRRIVETITTQHAVAIAVDNEGTVFWGEDGAQLLMTQRLRTPASKRSLSLGNAPDVIAAVHMNHRNTRLVSADAGGMRTWDPEAPQVPAFRLLTTQGAASDQVTDVAFSPDDSIIAGLHSGGLDFWRSDRDELIDVFTEDLQNATAMTYTTSGALAVGDSRGFLRVWRTTPQSTVVVRYEPRITDNSLVAVHLAPDIVLIGNSKAASVRVVWLDGSHPARVIEAPGLFTVAISDDGCTAAIMTNAGHMSVSRYSLCEAGSQQLPACDVPQDFKSHYFYLEIAGSHVRLYGDAGWIDVCEKSALHPWAPGATKTAVATSSGKRLGVVWEGQQTGVYDTEGRRLASCDALCVNANTYVALPEQRGLLLLSRDRLLRLDFASGKTEYLMQLPSEVRLSHAVSPDASTLAVADGDGMLRFIDLDAKEQMFEVTASGDSIDKIVFAADSLSAIAIADDGTVRRLDFTLPGDVNGLLAKLRSSSIDGELTP